MEGAAKGLNVAKNVEGSIKKWNKILSISSTLEMEKVHAIVKILFARSNSIYLKL